MSKKICFSSVLKQKRASQNALLRQNFPEQALGSLRNYMEEFLENPMAQYTLRYAQPTNLRTYNSRNGFEEGYNQLDQWISHKINSNKQNIYEAQSRRQIPNQLAKYIKGGKSPGKVSHTKNDFPQNHKNMDIKQICKQYAQSKKSGRESEREPPVWRFANRKQQQQTNEQEALFREKQKYKPMRCVIKQPTKNSMKYKAPEYEAEEQQLENEQQFKQKIGNSTGNFNGILNAAPTNQNRNQTHHIMKIVEEIKNSMIPQIQVMAERIIKDRNSVHDDEQMLINEQKKDIQDYLRLQNARKQIGEYLIMKNGISFDKVIKEGTIPIQSKVNFDADQQKILSSNNVGYSFSSDFQIPITSKQSIQNNINYQYQSKLANEADSRKKQKNSITSNKISLPNIDEVKSERDGNEKNDELIDSVAVTLKNRKLESHTPSIDRNFIKQIQSVAYVQESNGKLGSSKIQALEKQMQERIRQNSLKKGTLLQQITKTALSIDGGIQEDSQQVNISIAEGKLQQTNVIKEESPKKVQEPFSHNAKSVKQSQVLPANTIKIEFKKIPSSEHLDKLSELKNVSERTEGAKQSAKEPNPSLQNNPASQYFGLAYSNNLRNDGGLLRKNSITYPQANNSRSSANLIQQGDKQIKKQPITTVINHGTISQNSLPIISHQNVNNLNTLHTYHPNQNITFTNLPTGPTNSTNQSNPSQIISSKERINQVDQGKKIKITISPKYLGHQHDKHESIGNVADFKLNSRADENTQPSKYNPKTSSISYNHNPSSNNISIIQASQTNHVKIDTLFTNLSNVGNKIVTETRQTHQQNRERAHQNPMIRIQKYEKTQNQVPNKLTGQITGASIQFGGYTTSKTVTTNLGSQTSNNNAKNKPMNSIKNNESVKSSQQFEFDLDF